MIHRAFIPWRVNSIFGLNLNRQHRIVALRASHRIVFYGWAPSPCIPTLDLQLLVLHLCGVVCLLWLRKSPRVFVPGECILYVFTQQSRLIGERLKDLTNGRVARERSVCNMLMYRVLAG